MDQATATTTTTPPRTNTNSFAHAHAVAGFVVAELGNELPFAVELDEDFPAGWRAHLKFRQSRARGLLSFAALVDVPVTRAIVQYGIHLEVLVRIEDVEVRGSALVSPETEAELEGEATSAEPAPDADPDAEAEDEAGLESVQPVPLGSSVLASVPAITLVETPAGDQ
ncbi:hypothetical protein [Streptomyces sp. NPDC010273]|uniref:hypothetical protein n=1 Tax=Streptomyces sp. NPDC010273 TaxID=3364829 RepID=UPI0036EA80BD